MTVIDLDQFLGEPAKPFTHVTLDKKEWPVFLPDDLSEASYLKLQDAQAGLTQALEELAPTSYAQAQEGNPDIKTANKIKKIWAKNKSKVKKFTVHEKIDEGLYWPWDEQGPRKLKVTDDNGTPLDEATIEAEKSKIEVLISAEIKSQLDEVEGPTKFARIMQGDKEWGYLHSLHEVSAETLTRVASEVGLVIPLRSEQSIKMSEIPTLTKAQYPYRRQWCEALFDNPDFSLEGRPPKLVNFLFTKLQQEKAAFEKENQSNALQKKESSATKDKEAPKEEKALEPTSPG